tara:strand:+ start:368 stop:712 length:345 start_codon:yes stop_codon:yes gene_type:complete
MFSLFTRPTPEQAYDQALQDKLNELDIEHNLEHLQDALNSVSTQAGSHVLSNTLNSLNSLLALKLTGKHVIYLCNVKVELTFNKSGGLVSMQSAAPLPVVQSIHTKPALKGNLF